MCTRILISMLLCLSIHSVTFCSKAFGQTPGVESDSINCMSAIITLARAGLQWKLRAEYAEAEVEKLNGTISVLESVEERRAKSKPWLVSAGLMTGAGAVASMKSKYGILAMSAGITIAILKW